MMMLKSASKTVSRAIYESLHRNGVKDVFVYTGGAVMDLVDHFHPSKNTYGINLYTSSNEQNLVMSAIGYARKSGRVGTVIATSGPGILNCMTGVYDATTDGVPLVILGGQVPIKNFGRHTFQDAPSIPLMRRLTKWSHMITNPDINMVSKALDMAYIKATATGGSTSFVDMPKCVLSSKTTGTYTTGAGGLINKIKNFSLYKDSTSYTRHKNVFPSFGSSSPKIRQNYRYKRPVIIAGKGCADASQELADFANKYKIPITTTLHGLGCFDERHDLSLYMHGMHGSFVANQAIYNADLIIALGSRFDDRSIGNPHDYAPNIKNIILVNNNPNVITGISPSITIQQDCKSFLKSVLDCPELMNLDIDSVDWLNTINMWKSKHPYKKHTGTGGALSAGDVLSHLNSMLKHTQRHPYIITGVGNTQMNVARYLTYTKPNQLMTSGSLGVMGCALPYTIGAKIADKKSDILTIDGDGNFNMSLNDLITAVKYNIPLKIIILNNSKLGMVASWGDVFYNGRHTGVDIKNPDFAAIARAYGIEGISCERRRDLEPALHRFLTSDKSVLLNIKVAHSLCLPFTKPNSPLSESIVA